MIGFGKNVNENIFDQNRFGLLLGYRFNPRLRIEAGYLSTHEEILEDYPSLVNDDILACLVYAIQNITSKKYSKSVGMKFLIDAQLPQLFLLYGFEKRGLT